MKDSRVDVIVRVHDFSKLNLFKAAILSLEAQTYQCVEPIVVAQNASAAVLIELEEWLQGVFGDRPFQIHNVSAPLGHDVRSVLLNRGLAAAKGKFLAFLDFDDLVTPNAYQVLVDALNRSQAAIAVGGSKLVYIEKQNETWVTKRELRPFAWGRNKLDLFRENFIPIHSFLLNRSKVSPGDLRFDEQMVLCEDYDFLLRLAVKYAFDFSALDEVLAIYRARIGGGNTNPSLNAATTEHDRKRLARAGAAILATKNTLMIGMTISELCAQLPPRQTAKGWVGIFDRFPIFKRRAKMLARIIGIDERKF